MKDFSILTLLVSTLLSGSPVHGALSDQIVAYYNFEETDVTGLSNKAPGATAYNATRSAGGSYDSSANPSGPGFAGNAAFTSTTLGTSDRNALLAGKALNLVTDRNDSITVPLGTTELGNSFTISAWTWLAPGSTNTQTRFHAFETKDTGNFDVSWGTAAGSSVNYLGYLATGSSLAANNLAKNAWHHVVHVFSSDGTNTTLTQYVDGTKTGTLTAATSSMSFTGLYFGKSRDGTSGRNWDGMIDEVAIWKRALTAREINEVRARGMAAAGLFTDLATLGKAYLDVAAVNPDALTVTGTGIYNLNSLVMVTATPANGYLFGSWGGVLTGQPDTFSITLTGDIHESATAANDTNDNDGDGLNNYQEYIVYHTDPANPDTDGDGIADGAEVNQTATNPSVSDTTLISKLNANLGSVLTGVIAGTTSVSRDSSNGNLTLSLGLKGSANGTTWSDLPLNGAGTTVTPVNGQLEITAPAPSSSMNFYRVFKH
ncbi:hypothetical protein KBB96_03190 [Luteolibacter ambystomatis]|uniref:LamG-like jellyroll fold domain-containing protein n=1 Tax=Luteolibacter ambystomatis TaxID=2824561 RepID=A0A975J0R3_9BACT|nr:LamG domain-containing protein [Luteolibacter ambystomatis]QUE51900.1 hypothetical protein KBB96_03190 [Luteolibacter ambystomatis]